MTAATIDRPRQPGQQQQVLDQRAHPGRLGLHPAERVLHLGRERARVPPREFGVATDRGQRGPQLVAGIGGEPAQPRLAGVPARERGLDVPEHPVERGAELADLGPLVGVGHPVRQVNLAGQRTGSSRRASAGQSVTARLACRTRRDGTGWPAMSG